MITISANDLIAAAVIATLVIAAYYVGHFRGYLFGREKSKKMIEKLLRDKLYEIRFPDDMPANLKGKAREDIEKSFAEAEKEMKERGII